MAQTVKVCSMFMIVPFIRPWHNVIPAKGKLVIGVRPRFPALLHQLEPAHYNGRPSVVPGNNHHCPNLEIVGDHLRGSKRAVGGDLRGASRRREG